MIFIGSFSLTNLFETDQTMNSSHLPKHLYICIIGAVHSDRNFKIRGSMEFREVLCIHRFAGGLLVDCLLPFIVNADTYLRFLSNASEHRRFSTDWLMNNYHQPYPTFYRSMHFELSAMIKNSKMLIDTYIPRYFQAWNHRVQSTKNFFRSCMLNCYSPSEPCSSLFARNKICKFLRSVLYHALSLNPYQMLQLFSFSFFFFKERESKSHQVY